MFWMAAVLTVLQVQHPADPAWGTNTVTITIRNDSEQSRDVLIDWQSNSQSTGRGWGLETTVTIPPSKTTTFACDFIVPAFAGEVTHRFRIRDATDRAVLWRHEFTWNFPFGNSRTNGMKLWPKLQEVWKLQRAEFPPLRVVRRGNLAVHYLDGDVFVSSRIDDIFREREAIYRELVARLNPGFREPVSIYLFPDAESKFAYTMHRGMGWATGTLLVEILNAKEHMDPWHEMAHIVAHSVGDPPAFFSEGFAAWSQEGHLWDGYHADAWAAALNARGLLWPLPRLFTFGEIGTDESRAPVAYPQAASVCHYLIARYGFEKFREAYRTLKRGADAPNRAEFTRIFGAGVEDVEKAWLAALRETKEPPVPAAIIDQLAARYK